VDAFLKPEPHDGILSLHTGGGKTVCALYIASRLRLPTLVIVHNSFLRDQWEVRVRMFLPKARIGRIQGDKCEVEGKEFVIAMLQTLSMKEIPIATFKPLGLVVVDECHHIASEVFVQALPKVTGKYMLGLSATPERADKQQLDQIFESVCYSYPLRSAIEQGYLVSVKMEARPIAVDLDSIKQRAGDFETSELALSLLRAGIVEQVALAVRELAADRRTLVFTVSVDQAKLTAEALTAAGVSASWVAGELASSERRARLAAFSAGRIRVLCNCMVLTEGFDDPGVECIVMARPTQSKSLYVQCVGRGLRIAPGKPDCLLIDMVGLSRRHTLIQAPIIFGEEAELEARRAADAVGVGGLARTVRFAQDAAVHEFLQPPAEAAA
jgi:superfamily II DNA or RNA helicase